jgi:hypothetical protein
MSSTFPIPGDKDWEQDPLDDDVAWLYRLISGKSHIEVQEHFANGNFGERMCELLFAPRPVFHYYIQSAAMYLLSKHDDGDGNAEAASAFLHHLVAREKRDPGSLAAVYPLLKPSIDHVASRQSVFDAKTEIFGDFSKLAAEIRGTCCGG